jgi:hypothetical protein
VALGAGAAVFSALPAAWAALSTLALCGAVGAAAWASARLPVIPMLRLALLASFSFRLEINLFPIVKHHEDPRGLNLSLMLILSALLALSYLAERWRGEKRDKVFPPAYSICLGALFVWCALSVVYGTQGWLGVYALVSLASTALMSFVVAAHFSNRDALRQAVVFIAAAIGISSLIGILQYQFGWFTNWTLLGAVLDENDAKFGEGEMSRAAGLMQNANTFGWYLCTFAPVVVAMLLMRVKGFRRWQRWLFAAAAGLGLVALILTYARGSWLAFALSLVWLAALAYRALSASERGKFARQLAAIGVAAGVLCFPFAGSIYTRLTEDDGGAAYSRVPLIQVAAAMIEDNPVLGVGLNSYESAMRRYDETAEKITDGFDWPVHNIFLHMAAETGVPGLLLFLALICFALRQGWRVYRSQDPFLSALAAGLIVGLLAFLWTGFKEPGSLGGGILRFSFLFCGLLIAASRASRKVMGAE